MVRKQTFQNKPLFCLLLCNNAIYDALGPSVRPRLEMVPQPESLVQACRNKLLPLSKAHICSEVDPLKRYHIINSATKSVA